MPAAQKEDRFIHLVFMAQHGLKLKVRNAFSSAGIRITHVQAGILFLLAEEDGRAMSELSRQLSLDNSTVTGLVDRLEKAGYVRRRAKVNDRRVSLIFITLQGIKEAEKAAKVVNLVNEEIINGFSKKEIESFKKVLNRLIGKDQKA